MGLSRLRKYIVNGSIAHRGRCLISTIALLVANDEHVKQPSPSPLFSQLLDFCYKTQHAPVFTAIFWVSQIYPWSWLVTGANIFRSCLPFFNAKWRKHPSDLILSATSGKRCCPLYQWTDAIIIKQHWPAPGTPTPVAATYGLSIKDIWQKCGFTPSLSLAAFVRISSFWCNLPSPPRGRPQLRSSKPLLHVRWHANRACRYYQLICTGCQLSLAASAMKCDTNV